MICSMIKEMSNGSKDTSTIAPSMNEDEEMEEIRQMTKATIIKKGKKRDEEDKDAKRAKAEEKDKSLILPPKNTRSRG